MRCIDDNGVGAPEYGGGPCLGEHVHSVAVKGRLMCLTARIQKGMR